MWLPRGVSSSSCRSAVGILLAAGALLLPLPLEGAKVSVELYYEWLCPCCSRFMVKRLAGIFKDAICVYL